MAARAAAAAGPEPAAVVLEQVHAWASYLAGRPEPQLTPDVAAATGNTQLLLAHPQWTYTTAGLIAAAATGSLSAVQHILRTPGSNILPSVQVGAAAVEAGYADLVRWLVQPEQVARGYGCSSSAFCAAARSGSTAVLEVLLAAAPCPGRPTLEALHAAAQAGQYNTAVLLLNAGVFPVPSTLEAAGTGGSVDLLRLLSDMLRAHLEFPDSVTLTAAAGAGHLGTCKWLVKRGHIPGRKSMDAAVSGGHLQIVTWVARSWPDVKIDQSGLIEAARLGHLRMLQHVHHSWPVASKLGHTLMEVACRAGQTAVVQWLLAQNVAAQPGDFTLLANSSADNIGTLLQALLPTTHPCPEAMIAACKRRSLPCAQAILAGGTPISQNAMLEALATGDLALILWIHEHRNEAWPSDSCMVAAESGHIHAVEWLMHAVPDPSQPSRVCIDVAAREGHLPMIQFLHNLGIRGTSACITWAAERGHIHVLRWLFDHVRPTIAPISLAVAAGAGHLEVVVWLRQVMPTIPAGTAIVRASRHGHYDAVRWLLQNCADAEVSSEAIDAAACYGHVDVLHLLIHHGGSLSAVGLEQAVTHARMDILWGVRDLMPQALWHAMRSCIRERSRDVAFVLEKIMTPR